LYVDGLDIARHLEAPEQLEREFRDDPAAFARALSELDGSLSGHLVVRAWRARLATDPTALPAQDQPRAIAWSRVVGLGLCAAVAARLLTLGFDQDHPEQRLRFAAFAVLVPLGVLLRSSQRRALERRDAWFALAAALAIPFVGSSDVEHSQTGLLAIAHTPIFLVALACGAFAYHSQADAEQRAEVVAIAVEVAIISLALLFAGALLAGLTVGTFSLIEIDVKQAYLENVVIPCAAAAPVVAAGLERVRATRNERLGPLLARVFSPLVLTTLLAYALAIVGTQRNPYQDRESLAMLYAMLLASAVLATSMVMVPRGGVLPRRIAIAACAICALTAAVDALALSAIAYRFASFGLTPNRLAVLGGNLLLFTYLGGFSLALIRGLRSARDPRPPLRWIAGFMPMFAVWSALWIFVFPLLFGFE
jgi:hypothetical protein